MNGLLIKDLCILKLQKKFFIVIIAIAVITTLTTKDISFLMGYLMFILPMLTLSTMSYDEFDNGNAFLFTLPISKKLYVIEKYLLGVILGLSAFCLSLLISLIFGSIYGMSAILEGLPAFPVTLALMLVVLSVMLPIQFKFGAERGRLAMLVLSGVAVVIGFAGVKLLEKFNIDINALDAYISTLSGLDIGMIIAASAAAVIGIFILSAAVSVGIMEKKEF